MSRSIGASPRRVLTRKNVVLVRYFVSSAVTRDAESPRLVQAVGVLLKERPLAHVGTATSTDGFVQMMVLVALGTISAVIMATMLTATDGSSNTAALERLVETDALTISGFNRLEAAMLNPTDDLAIRALRLDTPVEIQVGGNRVALQIEGVGGKIDPLRTARDAIVRYMANSPLTTGERATVMAAIDKARDTNSAYAGYTAVLIGLLDHRANRELEQDFTQFADHSGIDPAYASSRVIAAIPDLSASTVAGISGSTIQDLAVRNLQSRYFAPNGSRYSLVTIIDWGQNQSAQRRLPVEVSSAGRLVALGAPS